MLFAGQHDFGVAARDQLPVTDQLAPRILGLPMAVDLPERSVEQVVAAVAAGVAGR